ncbi:ROK family protein [Microbispora sp. NBC_01389]|uniref:ROK family protein n=1 Tax=Microbispora sp. NBC_01389 TaxID=2903584 RepID=UPI0032526BAA
MSQAVRHDAMRARNLALVLGEVGARGAVTRAALAEITGLTKTTVSKLVGDLIEGGLVVETGAVRDGERGRPGVELRISGRRVAALGLEVNVDYLAVCVVDLARTVRLRRTQAVDNRAAPPVDSIARLGDLAASVVDEAVEKGLRVVGGVLAVPGPVDRTTGDVRNAPNLGWRDVPLASLIRHFPFPVRVENEANLAALGELWFGSGLSDFLHVSGEIGIGAGLVVRGRLFRGAHGFAGELGHVVVAPDGPRCRCGGRGCLEQYAGQDALLAAAGVVRGQLGVARVAQRLREGDERARAACERAAWALGVALSSAIHLVDPGAIVLGGIYAPLFRWIGDVVGDTLRGRLGQMRGTVPPVIVSRLGAEAAALGAAGQVIEQVMADPAALLHA